MNNRLLRRWLPITKPKLKSGGPLSRRRVSGASDAEVLLPAVTRGVPDLLLDVAQLLTKHLSNLAHDRAIGGRCAAAAHSRSRMGQRRGLSVGSEMPFSAPCAARSSDRPRSASATTPTSRLSRLGTGRRRTLMFRITCAAFSSHRFRSKADALRHNLSRRRGDRMMRRREFIPLLGGAAAGCPLAASAQEPARKIVKLGFLQAFRNENSVAFVQGLRSAGYIEGQNAFVSGDHRSKRLIDRNLQPN